MDFGLPFFFLNAKAYPVFDVPKSIPIEQSGSEDAENLEAGPPSDTCFLFMVLQFVLCSVPSGRARKVYSSQKVEQAT
jgi:hypothetical protein